MRSMNLLASVLFASVAVVAAVQAGCSSGNNGGGTSSNPPFDAGVVVVPDGGSMFAGPVTITVSGNGYVQSNDGTGGDGGTGPSVNCGTLANGSKGTACTAAQGLTLYANPNMGAAWGDWSATVDGGAVEVQASQDYAVISATPNPLTANFVTQSNGPDSAAPPVVPMDSGTGGG